MLYRIFLCVAIFVLLLTSCDNTVNPKQVTITSKENQLLPDKKTVKSVIVDIIPFNDMPLELTEDIFRTFKNIYPNIKLLRPISMTKSAYSTARGRWIADTLISNLALLTPEGHVTLGLTTKDICTNSNNIPDWGIMGLGYCPGKSCVASAHRLTKQNLQEQFFKIAIHELGHTQGLDHCPNPTCLMRDAKGKNTTNQEKEFCLECKKILERVGWCFADTLEFQ